MNILFPKSETSNKTVFQSVFNAFHSLIVFIMFLIGITTPLMMLEGLSGGDVAVKLAALMFLGFIMLLTRMFYYVRYKVHPKLGRLARFFMWLLGLAALGRLVDIFV